ncbi:TELO2-interacting protein 1 like protein [Melipona quadrifasciata]|uniref:TELO2-interacting protein 1 like protein n=1 Tax=Melipona quadrifasciata TaxID=166423 RepID=A0A0M8ZXQ2_9HYME|nr:TELO2-interacting protein 1 like protein [Melipona quadrifasciata]
MERLKIQEAFTTLKPFCDALMKNPNVEIARNIANVLPKISTKVTEDLFEYILFPFIVHLPSNKLNRNIKEELIKTTQALICRTKISKVKYFNELYSCLLIQIYDKTEKNMVITGHEELKTAVLSCIKTLINSCFTNVLEQIYTKENAAKVGQGILLSITIGRTEKSNLLRLEAVETIMALCQISDESNQFDPVWHDQVADIIMLFLPGIVSGLQEIATGNETQGHKLTMIALRAWSKVISLVMKDKEEKDYTPSLNDLIKINNEKPIDSMDSVDVFSNMKNENELAKDLKSTTRNKEWFNACAIKLSMLVQQLHVLIRHSHYKVREELVKSIHLLLTSCPRNMKPNIILLIEYLMFLTEDEFPAVRDKADEVLNTIFTNFTQSNNIRSVMELLEENFYNLLTKLPRIIRRSDDNDQLACLNQIASYLKLLGEKRLPHIMMSAPHVHRLILALIYVSELEYSNVSLLQAVNVKDLDDPAYSYGPHLWRQFKFIQNNACEARVIAICKYLGEFGDLRILVDTILDLMLNAPQHIKELILLLNWIMCVPVKDSSVLSIYKEIVKFYINPEFWYPPIEINKDTSLRVAQSNVIRCCLLLEGLGLIAQNLKLDYDRFLLTTLYIVIERAGSGHSLISFVGTQTLEQIAKSQGHDTVGDLLRANVDYVSYHVGIKLRKVEYNPDVLDVIEVVMKYKRQENIPFYIEIVEDILKHSTHFLPSKEIEISLIAMSILQEGLEILTNFENQLLPIVHILWHPLVDRFQDENVLIINRAWQLLNVVARLSKDFIRQRTLKHVLPALSKFLHNSAKESYNKSSENIYKFTQTYKLQKELLCTLGQMTKNLHFHEREIFTVLSIVEPYLDKHQNSVLQECCVQLYKDIADYNSDIVWVKCLGIFNSKVKKIVSDATFSHTDLMVCNFFKEHNNYNY